jgi:hypothetical protein
MCRARAASGEKGILQKCRRDKFSNRGNNPLVSLTYSVFHFSFGGK